MAFPEKLLNPEERIILDLRPHWSFLAREMLLFLGGLAVLIGALVISRADIADNDVFNSGIVILGLLVLAAAAAVLLRQLLAWRGVNMVVTSERMVVRTGVLAKSGIEVPLDRINTVFFNQSLLGRLIGSGDLSVESAGEDGRQDFTNVWRPNRVQQVIYQAKEEAEDRDRQDAAQALVHAQRAANPAAVVAAAATAPASIPEQIDQLDKLRTRGIITNAEFEAKKTELLGRM